MFTNYYILILVIPMLQNEFIILYVLSRNLLLNLKKNKYLG